MGDKPTVGFIGMGIMGEPMAMHLIAAGFPLVVHDHSLSKVEKLVAAGASDGASAKGVAQRAEIILLCLPDGPDVEEAILGDDGVLHGVSAGKIVVDMSTISPVVARSLGVACQKAGIEFLDAPVSGGQIGAQQGTLSIMVGGNEQAFARVLPIFQAMGKNILRMGDVGAGQVTKSCNQMIVAVTNAAVSEAMVYATKAGVDPVQVRQALLGGSGYSRFLENNTPRFFSRNFQPGFKARLMYKDLNIVLSTAREYGMPLPMTSLVHAFFTALMGAGKGDLDGSALVTVFEAMAGTEVKSPSAK